MKTVLITGGTGFFGSWMARTAPPGFDLERMNREDYWHTVPHWFSDRYVKHYDYIVHLANVDPSLVLKCARHHRARLLYVSSGAIYHPEHDTTYRRNKIFWERECLESGAQVVIARPFAFMDSSESWVTFFANARAGLPLEIWGDGSTERSYMHGRDLGEWLWAILLYGEPGQAYDVGSDRAITIERLARRIQAFTGSEIRYVDKPIPMPTYLPDAERTARTKELLKLYQQNREGSQL